MDRINTIQFEILEYLGGWYGYLTTSQIQALTKKSSAGYIREMVGKLVKGGYLRSFRLEVSHKVRSENMYTITPLGAELLQSHTDIYTAIKTHVNSSPLVVKDFNHRTSTSWCAIKIIEYLKANNSNVQSLLFYYDKQGSVKKKNIVSKTALHIQGHGTYIPDAIIQTDTDLILLEAFCDRNHKRIMASLATHVKGLGAGVPGVTYNMNVNAKIISVFTHRGIMQGVMKELQANTEFSKEMGMLFFFCVLEDLKTNGFENTLTDIYQNHCQLS